MSFKGTYAAGKASRRILSSNQCFSSVVLFLNTLYFNIYKLLTCQDVFAGGDPLALLKAFEVALKGINIYFATTRIAIKFNIFSLARLFFYLFYHIILFLKILFILSINTHSYTARHDVR